MLGERIYQYRVKKNLSQLDLADALEVSRQSVSKWENNACAPELDKLMRMCEVFEVSLDELVRGESGENGVGPFSEGWKETASETQGKEQSEEQEEVVEPMQKKVGTILIGMAVLVLAGSFFLSARWLFGLYVSVLLLAIGTVCILVKKHTVLCCIWSAFVLTYLNLELLSPGILWMDLRFFLLDFFHESGISDVAFSRLLLLAMLFLIIITVYLIKKQASRGDKG